MSLLSRRPYVPELPPATSRWHKPARLARPACHVLFFAVVATAGVQLQVVDAKNAAAGREADRIYREALADYEQALADWERQQGPSGRPVASTGPSQFVQAKRLAAMAAAMRVARTKRHKGAIPRWCRAIRQFWAGRNIYGPVREAGVADPLSGELLPGRTAPHRPPPRLGATPEEIVDADASMHPNMPFVVILLTPLAQLPPQITVSVVNVLKILALLAAIFAAAAVTNHARHRMGEWVVGLAVLFALSTIIGDLQHGNTNIFVLAAVAGHLWLYRRGHDAAAGALLAVGVCLKMTPALFGLYWLYQRNWRLLGGLAIALALAVVVIPLAALGPERYDLLTGSWLSNLIVPGLLKGAPYPIHVNQSLSGVFSRLLMRGNLYFGPDDKPMAERFAYVNVASLSPAAGRYVLLAIKLAILAVLAWAVSRGKLPRDDGRRALHYGLVAAGMLILNQRTWEHHAVVLLIAYLPLWYAIAYGRFGRRLRIACLAAAIAAGVMDAAMSGSLYPRELADTLEAYGPTFLHFVTVFVLCVVLLRSLRRTGRDQNPPYAPDGQRL